MQIVSSWKKKKKKKKKEMKNRTNLLSVELTQRVIKVNKNNIQSN